MGFWVLLGCPVWPEPSFKDKIFNSAGIEVWSLIVSTALLCLAAHVWRKADGVARAEGEWFLRTFKRRQRGGCFFVKGGFGESFWFFVPGEHANVPSFWFRSRGTSKCALAPVFIPGEHPPKPPFWKTAPLATPETLEK